MGVKSLWTLLTPVGRPVLLETVEGKSMAIDSSIWIYQFQATMRDKEGRALVNAHVLGFLRRISKLLFYGIKPVFVFDGGAPVLKKSTLTERKKKKSGAAVSHVKIAERLLAAQMRREALNHAQRKHPDKGKGKANDIEQHTVYLEDIDSSMPRTPAKPKDQTSPTPSSKKKKKYYDHDPYRLPEVDLDKVIAEATNAKAPDPRLATEDEIRAFIEEMRPEDFDVTSPEFRELPTEVQYEIIGDLRLKSRQTSYARLQKMLQTAQTPLDFSKQQIVNLKQRNALTQQLLMTTDSIGNAHISIPVRIASERNKEYVLTKNEGVEGGWVLAIQDKAGTAPDKPILIDLEKEEDEEVEENEDEDMEEVDVSGVVDPDLRRHQREMTLSAIARRYTPKKLSPLTTKPIGRKKNSKPLFELSDDEDDEIRRAMGQLNEEEDEELAYAIQESLDQAREAAQYQSDLSPMPATPTKTPGEIPGFPSPSQPSSSHEAEEFTPSRLQTQLSIAGAGPFRNPLTQNKTSFGRPMLLSSDVHSFSSGSIFKHDNEGFNDSASIPSADPTSISGSRALTDSEEDGEMEEVQVPVSRHANMSEKFANPEPIIVADSEDEEDMEEVEVDKSELVQESIVSQEQFVSEIPEPQTDIRVSMAGDVVATSQTVVGAENSQGTLFALSRSSSPIMEQDDSLTLAGTSATDAIMFNAAVPEQLNGEEHEEQTEERIDEEEAEHWDAAQEMDPTTEEGEFAKFLSQVKGRDLNDVRKEIDDEIKVLNEQRKAALRNSEDITQQMISQIMTMLRLFGIPYITAPMEAEAQCAELVSLGLVDGVITDDSDVFLFGAQRVYKNMFNQSKTVELFLLSDLERELGLDRDTLIRLAYLLGSDYTEGLSGVGPVVAMELLKEFPGKEGLHRFADWWRRVQEGKDKEQESNTKFRKQFKKKFKDLYLSADWPNPAVRDAYYHPTVDSSEEPFKWGLPDLDALRTFFKEELGWNQTKVDELLLPIIQKMNRRKNVAAGTVMQGNLTDWFNRTSGPTYEGNMAPRKKEVYTSRRLQQVVAEFRKRRKSGSATLNQNEDMSQNEDEEEEREPVEPARKKQKNSRAAGQGTRVERGSMRRKGRGSKAGKGARKGKGKAKMREDDDESDYLNGSDEESTGGENKEVRIEVPLKVELRPRPPREGLISSGGGASVHFGQ